ncbi:MAG: hypothetical protein ACLFUL_15105 [Desulfobacteraceae bacterium]
MWYDFYYRGSIKDPANQEEVIKLARGFWPDSTLIHSAPEKSFETKRIISWEETRTETYPFDFYGIFYLWKSNHLELGQMIFDRTDGGRMVSFSKLPEGYGIKPIDPEARDQTDFDVSVRALGHTRTADIRAFALLLYLVKHRYCLNLKVFDQKGVYEEVEHLIARLLLADAMWDKSLGFSGCRNLFEDAFEKKYGTSASDHIDDPLGVAGFKATDKEEDWQLFVEDFMVPNPVNSITSVYQAAAAKLNAEEKQK